MQLFQCTPKSSADNIMKLRRNSKSAVCSPSASHPAITGTPSANGASHGHRCSRLGAGDGAPAQRRDGANEQDLAVSLGPVEEQQRKC
jgi:hypothetical protein